MIKTRILHKSLVNYGLMQVPIGPFIFKPHLGLTLLVIFFLPILLGLSYWQWQRGLEKETLLATYQHSQTAKTLIFQGSHSLPVPEFQPLSITGTLDTQHIFFLDNKIHEARAGFEVLVPMQLEQGEWLLVNFGWLPRNIKRNELPELPRFPTGQITLLGRADFPHKQYLLLGTYLEVLPANRVIIQAIDYEKLNQYLGKTLLPIVLLLDAQPHSPLVRDWQPPKNMPPEKHFGYALQWLLLAITLLALYVGFCVKK